MKNVVITGAGRGIGLALTKEFLKSGAQVLATYRNAKTAGDLLELAALSKGKLETSVLDVASDAGFAGFARELARIGRVDVLVNNAGVIGDKNASLRDLDLARVARVFETNTFGPMRATRAALPYLGDGAVVASITSLMGSIADNGSGGYYDYRMSKTALNMFNKSLAMELPRVACLVLHPGWVQTDMGGSGAPTTPEQSAQGLHKIIVSAGPKETGRFFDFTGKELPW